MNKRKKINIIGIVVGVVCAFAIGMCAVVLYHFHWNLTLDNVKLVESKNLINNPNRGFYRIYGFRIEDESVNWKQDVDKRIKNDDDATLALIEVNIQAYKDGKITDAGMNNIRELFDALSKQNKQYIVRFLYDWNGENQVYEPKNIRVILDHMKQLKEIMNEYADHIFTLQGLFIGNCGEMNNTQYIDEESLQTLASTLLSVCDNDMYLSVITIICVNDRIAPLF